MIKLIFLLRVVLVALLPATVFADAPVLLEVEVADQSGGESLKLSFTMEDLQALPVVSFDTETIWFTGSQHFTGVPLAALMQQAGVTEGLLEVSGSDDFMRQISMQAAAESGAIVAYERNGVSMSVRRKGPLRIVYPYDDFPPLKRDVLFTNTIWQLVRIVVKPEIK